MDQENPMRLLLDAEVHPRHGAIRRIGSSLLAKLRRVLFQHGPGSSLRDLVDHDERSHEYRGAQHEHASFSAAEHLPVNVRGYPAFQRRRRTEAQSLSGSPGRAELGTGGAFAPPPCWAGSRRTVISSPPSSSAFGGYISFTQVTTTSTTCSTVKG